MSLLKSEQPALEAKKLPRRKTPRKPTASLYEDWSEHQLMNRASIKGIQGWQNMTKDELIRALRQG